MPTSVLSRKRSLLALKHFMPVRIVDRLNFLQQRTQIFAPAAPMPLPVLVVTGFLGSGKTTMVKQTHGK